MIDIDKKLWKNYQKRGIKVFLVDGNAVRNNLGVSYGIGGHSKAYDFIPKNEIWLEKTLDPAERDMILLHELYERRRMIRDKWNYMRAHHAATIAEWYARKNPQKTASKIREVLSI
jgi:hypothetical protein